ncbi:unnamed protein product [Mytilus coruscus]|uniref:Uncharacterized protein n=1 Tax=Mytilus coruscus TaxID=42192 RepID=A0A6J8CCK5_MYTCO|nr:unnamed protein product [Mytilus coruscus]
MKTSDNAYRHDKNILTTSTIAYGFIIDKIPSNVIGPAAKAEKVKRPSISTAGTIEEWAYFESRWSDFVEATKITGRDKVVQLLECCDEQLRKNLKRSAGEIITQFVEAKDSGKRSASTLLDSQMDQAAIRSYKKAKQTAMRDNMKFVHIVANRNTAKVHQLVSVNQIALHIAISVETATVNTPLKREACIARRMISDSFPTIGEIDKTQPTLGTENHQNISNKIGSVNGLATTCDCPKWKLPPPMPTKLPYPASEANLAKMKQFPMDY